MTPTGNDRVELERAAGKRSLADHLLELLLPHENLGGAVYGTITVGTLLAVESGLLHETYLETVGSVALTLALYWLAHTYANLLGRRIAARERLTATALGRALGRDWAIFRGAAAPLLALLGCWALGVSQSTAVTVGVWTAVISVVVLELLAGIRARAQPAELALEGCVGIAMGLGVLALRAILH